MSNSHSGALLACIDRSALGACSSASVGSGSSGDMASTAVLVVLLALALVGSLSNGLGVLLVLVDGPVEDVVVLESLTNEQVAEDLAEVAVVGLVVEAEGTSVVQVDGKLVGKAAAENLGGGSHLLLHDAVILLLLSGSLQTLPRQRATAEVEHNIAEGLHIVSSRLLDTKMGVDGGISSSTSQVLVLSVRDMEVSLGIAVFLGQTKVNNVNLVAALANAHEEVVWLDITVDEGLGVDVLNSGDELVGEQEDRLQRELSVAEVEEILQAGSEEIQNHGIVVTLSTEPADEGDADAASE